MKIGITERGDAALDLSWVNACKTRQVDGCVAITKNCTQVFTRAVLDLTRDGFPVIVHATCTGWGGTPMEPNVPDFKTQLEKACWIVGMGLPASRMVFRIDPIIPTAEGLEKAKAVLDTLESFHLTRPRIRVSVMDGYRHALARMQARGYDVTGLEYQATDAQMKQVSDLLHNYPFLYETCAEPRLVKLDPKRFLQTGCVSHVDLKVMNLLPIRPWDVNGQKRNGCMCLTCKTELLSNRHPCGHNCAYCYWKD